MVAKLRPYRVECVVESQFLTSDGTKNWEFCLEDLKKSGLEPDDMLIEAPGNLELPNFALAGYHIPYWDVQGRVVTELGSNKCVMWRVRYLIPPMSRASRYGQPSRESLGRHGLPSFLPYLQPYPKEYDNDSEIIYCVEGEKKTAAVIKHFQTAAFGISGCQMWGDPGGTGGIHPWILQYLREHGRREVHIIPDADVLRYDICKAYGNFANALEREGFQVQLLHPPDKIDDYIVQRKSAGDFKPDLLSHIERFGPDRLVQSPMSLAKAYNLAFRPGAPDKNGENKPGTVYQHSSNVMKLMEEHHAFPKFWRNLDTNRVMVGEEIATPDLTEMEIANHFQHNFGFDKVSSRLVYSCIQALAKRNQRSPMLESIRGTIWDGTPRLSTWLTRLWGVEDSDYVKEIATKWLVSACARLDKPGSKIDWMMIVVGPQGTGKTSMPGLMFKGNSLTLYGEQNDKDLHMLLHSALVVGFDELDSFSKKESSNLKAMITRNEDAFRPPYGASIENFPRRFTLYGSGNRYEFLQHDPSGYRRYAIVEVKTILDFTGLQAEVDQLWAEAWHVYRREQLRWWEIDNVSDIARNYTIPNIIEERIGNWMRAQNAAKHGDMVKDGVLQFTMSQLLVGIGEENGGRNPHMTREIAAILRGMGAMQKVVWIHGVAARTYYLPVGP
jgi:Virulence-associated protein E